MLDPKIIDFAKRLIQADTKKRQRPFFDELNRKVSKLQKSGNHPLESSTGRKIIRKFFTKELEDIASVVWESVQRAHKALGSQLSDTLACDLKEEATLFLSETKKELLEFMMKQPGFTKDDTANSTLDSAKNDACKKIDIEIDLYVNSLTNKPTEKDRESKNGVKAKGSMLKMTVSSSKDNWEAIKSEYGISKRDFGKKINFVSDSFKRKIIFRDVEHAFVLASEGFAKPAVILAGGVIEELLRLYLEHKKIQPKCDKFFAYIEACENNKLLKRGVSRLTDSIRDFRNLVHLDNEKTKRHTISKSTAKGAVASIFTIANDFQKV